MLLCETNVIEVGSCVIGSLVDNGNGTHTFYPGDGSDITFNTSYLASASFDSSTRLVTLTMSDSTEYTYTIDCPTNTTLTIGEFADDENPTTAEVNTYLSGLVTPPICSSTLVYSTPNGDYYVWIVNGDNTATLIEKNTILNLLTNHELLGQHTALDITNDAVIGGDIYLENNKSLFIENTLNNPVIGIRLDNNGTWLYGNGYLRVKNNWVSVGTNDPTSRLDIQQSVDNANNGLAITPISGDNAKIYIDASNNLQIQRGSTDVITVDDSGNVSVSGTQLLQVNSTGQTANSVADNLVIEQNGSSGITIFSGSANTGNIYFGDSAGNARGKFVYDHSDDTFKFSAAAGAQALSISNTEVVVSKYVGINQSSPVAYLHVNANFSGGTPTGFSASRDLLLLTRQNQPVGMVLSAGETHTAAVYLGDAAKYDAGYVAYNNDTGNLSFGAENTVTFDDPATFASDITATGDLTVDVIRGSTSGNLSLRPQAGNNWQHVSLYGTDGAGADQLALEVHSNSVRLYKQLEMLNNQAIYWADSGGQYHQILKVTSNNSVYVGPLAYDVANTLGSTIIQSMQDIKLKPRNATTDGFQDGLTIAAQTGNVTVYNDLTVDGVIMIGTAGSVNRVEFANGNYFNENINGTFQIGLNGVLTFEKAGGGNLYTKFALGDSGTLTFLDTSENVNASIGGDGNATFTGDLSVGDGVSLSTINLNGAQFVATPANTNNIKIGSGAFPNWSGNYNIAIGTNSGGAATLTGSTTLVGAISGYGATLNGSVGIGYYALRDSSASLTTALGKFAGQLSTANNAVYLGHAMGKSNAVNGTLEIGAYETFPIISGTMSNTTIQELSLNANTIIGGDLTVATDLLVVDSGADSVTINADDFIIADAAGNPLYELDTTWDTLNFVGRGSNGTGVAIGGPQTVQNVGSSILIGRAVYGGQLHDGVADAAAVVIGPYSGDNTTIPIYGISIGASSARNITGAIGSYSLFLGAYAGNDLTLSSGSTITAVGGRSLLSGNGNFSNVTAIGHQAGYEAISGLSSVLVGNNSGYQADASYAVIIGSSAGSNATIDSGQLIGNSAGNNVDTSYITFIGNNAGQYVNTAYQIGIGYYAAAQDIGHTNNSYGGIFIGGQAGRSADVYFGAGIGYEALRDATGQRIVAVGYRAGYNSTGENSTLLGHQAGKDSSGDRAVAIGNNSAISSTSHRGVFVGDDAGNGTTGDYVVGIGYNTLRDSPATYTIAIGNSAGENTTANYNVFLGPAAGKNFLDTGNTYTLGIGSSALENVTSGANTIAIGYLSGYNAVLADNSIFLGPLSGKEVDGTYNIALGRGAGEAYVGSRAILIGNEQGKNASGDGLLSIGAYLGQSIITGFMTSNGVGQTLDINADTTINGDIFVPSPTVPANASDTGSTGQIAWDASYIYVCTAANTWVRAALATW